MIALFQLQFVHQQEVIDELRSMIHHSEITIAEIARANNVATDHRKTEDHAELRKEIETFKIIYAELKSEFLKFLTKTL